MPCFPTVELCSRDLSSLQLYCGGVELPSDSRELSPTRELRLLTECSQHCDLNLLRDVVSTLTMEAGGEAVNQTTKGEQLTSRI